MEGPQCGGGGDASNGDTYDALTSRYVILLHRLSRTADLDEALGDLNAGWPGGVVAGAPISDKLADKVNTCYRVIAATPAAHPIAFAEDFRFPRAEQMKVEITTIWCNRDSTTTPVRFRNGARKLIRYAKKTNFRNIPKNRCD
ncbi:hypothetical protein J6590_052206 [Homalodisca vitripennis]|nr:hypothetical protein J6590_052206 [Homalodisca vitripennis]